MECAHDQHHRPAATRRGTPSFVGPSVTEEVEHFRDNRNAERVAALPVIPESFQRRHQRDCQARDIARIRCPEPTFFFCTITITLTRSQRQSHNWPQVAKPAAGYMLNIELEKNVRVPRSRETQSQQQSHARVVSHRLGGHFHDSPQLDGPPCSIPPQIHPRMHKILTIRYRL